MVLAVVLSALASALPLGKGAVKVLNEESFEHLTQAATGATTGDWFVMFSDDSCSHCRQAAPAMEQLVLATSGEGVGVSVAVVKCSSDDSQWVCKRFAVKSYPTFLLFRRSLMYEYQGQRDKDSMLNFITTPTAELRVTGRVPPAEFGLVDKAMASLQDLERADPTIFYVTAVLCVITAGLFVVLMCLPMPRVEAPRKKQPAAAAPSVNCSAAAAKRSAAPEGKKDK